MTDHADEFGPYLADALTDPAFRAAYDDAGTRVQLRGDLIGLRETLGLDLREVARRMGVTTKAVDRFEGIDGTDPYLSWLQRYARALGARIRIEIEEPGPT